MMNKKVLIVPDSFKNSLTAQEVSEALENGFNYFKGELEVITFPFADGGEGSVEIIRRFIAVEERVCYTFDPLLKPIRAGYFIDKINKIAYIESAKVIGLEVLDRDPDCFNSSTFGLGILIKDALDQGMEEITIFLGGSATCDAGVGMAAALGFEFIQDNRLLERPLASDIISIDKIKKDNVHDRIKSCIFRIAVDVTNPLYGEKGTARVFARQKGANDGQIEILEASMEKMADLIFKEKGYNIQSFEGSGAAGGLGAGGMFFLGGEIDSAFDILSEISGLEKKIESSDIIVTGEGHIDDQSFDGKLISKIKSLADRHNKKVWLICAIRSISEKEALRMGYEQIQSLYKSMPKEIDDHETSRKLYKTAKRWAADLLNIP